MKKKEENLNSRLKTNTTKKGKLAEDVAFQYLTKLNHEILELNWSVQKAEIDIISRLEGLLVFTEVKSRNSRVFGDPATMVTKRKQRLLVSAATAFMEKINYDGEFRFDIITLTGYDLYKCNLEHYEDAFFPGLEF